MNYIFVETFRSSEILDLDGPHEDLDAGHILPEREGGAEARDHRSKRLRQNLPQWGNPL